MNYSGSFWSVFLSGDDDAQDNSVLLPQNYNGFISRNLSNFRSETPHTNNIAPRTTTETPAALLPALWGGYYP